MTLLELGQSKQVALRWLHKTDSVRCKLSSSHLPALVLEFLQQLLASGTDGICAHGQFRFLVHYRADPRSLIETMSLLNQGKQIAICANFDMLRHVLFLLGCLFFASLEFFRLKSVQPVVPIYRLLANEPQVGLPSDHSVAVLDNISSILRRILAFFAQKVVPQKQVHWQARPQMLQLPFHRLAIFLPIILSLLEWIAFL